jgi:hypothetical protein
MRAVADATEAAHCYADSINDLNALAHRGPASLGTDAHTTFRVLESRDGPTAGRFGASIGFQSGKVSVFRAGTLRP